MIILERMPRKIVLRRCSESRDQVREQVVHIWGRRIPGRGSFRCKGPEAAACLVYSSTCEEGSVATTLFKK